MTNTTAETLMTDAFLLVAGSEARRAENASRNAAAKPSKYAPDSVDSKSLVAWQEQEGRKWRSVEVVSTMRGWSVRASSGLDNFALLYVAESFTDAIAWCRRWVEEDAYRYAFVRT